MKKQFSSVMLYLLTLSILFIFEIPFTDASIVQGMGNGEEFSGSTVVFVEPENITARMGETFDIAVKISDVEDLFGFDVRMSWDPNIVKYVSHSVTVPVESHPNGVLHEPIFQIKDEVNETGCAGAWKTPGILLWVAYLSLPIAPSFNGSGTILIITFKVVKIGECGLNLTRVDLSTPVGGKIPKDIRSGYFESLPTDHDVAVFLNVQRHVPSQTPIEVNATVANAGLFPEIDVALNLMINSEVVDAVVVSLGVDESYVLSYMWTPTDEAFYNVSTFALPVIDEVSLGNNYDESEVLVAEIIKVPEHFSSIQEAIDIAIPGTTIHVSSGIYYEYLVINKKLALVGEGNTSIIDGKGTAYIIQVRVGDTSIDGFTIRNGTRCGIHINRANDVKILNNLIKDIPRGPGIFLFESTKVNIISNSIIDARDGGILIGYSHNNTLKRNTITGGSRLGSIQLHYSDHNKVLGNDIRIGDTGISLEDAWSNTIKRNEVSECSVGLGVSNGGSNLIIQNTISGNEWGIYLYESTDGNEIYHNNFISNIAQAKTWPGNIWHNGDYEGNYWDDYTGIDLDDDGVGDTMLPHQGVDSYPLIDPWNALTAEVTFDDKVDLSDIITVASVYVIREGESKWLPQADLAPPWGIIDILDIVTAAYHHGQQH